jgi:enoyl-[acyl-carrier protein] reductase III
MSRRFENKVSLITGSSRGIGRALALTLARDGAAVVVNYVRNADLAAETVREIEALGSRAIAVQAVASTTSSRTRRQARSRRSPI